MTTLFSASSARAGSWVFTCSGSGSSTVNFPNGTSTVTPWTIPAAQTGSFSLGGNVSASNYFAANAKATVTVTVTATWTHATGQTNTTDPAPPKVWLCESSSAHWSGAQNTGSASDGLGGEYKLTPNNGFYGGTANSSDANNTVPAPVPPAYWKSWTVTGGAVTLPTRTLKAEADYTLTPLGYYCAASVDSYSVTVHAQPYNFHIGAYVDGVGILHPTGVNNDSHGQIHFHYVWSSTDGNLSDLTSCVVYEHISYLGNNFGSYSTNAQGIAIYTPPLPFNYTVEQTYNQPDPYGSNPTPGTQGFQDDFLLLGQPDANGNPPPVNTVIPKPYLTAAYTSTQDWKFNDSLTGESGVELLGPLTITRSVVEDFASTTNPWVYTVSESGYSNTLTLP